MFGCWGFEITWAPKIWRITACLTVFKGLAPLFFFESLGSRSGCFRLSRGQESMFGLEYDSGHGSGYVPGYVS